jgi:hypothetical protein
MQIKERPISEIFGLTCDDDLKCVSKCQCETQNSKTNEVKLDYIDTKTKYTKVGIYPYRFDYLKTTSNEYAKKEEKYNEKGQYGLSSTLNVTTNEVEKSITSCNLINMLRHTEQKNDVGFVGNSNQNCASAHTGIYCYHLDDSNNVVDKTSKVIKLTSTSIAPIQIKTRKGSTILDSYNDIFKGVFIKNDCKCSSKKISGTWKSLSGNPWFADSQEGEKISPSGTSGDVSFAYTNDVAMSADGDTVAIGGARDENLEGSIWIYDRTCEGFWKLRGSKFRASDNIGNAQQGSAIALSADANILVSGGIADDGNIGAAWVWKWDKKEKSWNEIQKIIPPSTGSGSYIGTNIYFGDDIAISDDGRTIAIGAGGTIAFPGGDNGGIGATWIYVYDATSFTYVFQQKLVGAGNIGNSQQGFSIALSSTGNLLAVGGEFDNSGIGAVWTFSRDSSGVWSQIGNKIIPTNYLGSNPQLGYSVSISGDGTILAVGANNELNAAGWATGAARVYKWNGSSWVQMGEKIIGSDIIFNPILSRTWQGTSISLSKNGLSLAVGGPSDNANIGATWEFTSNGTFWIQRKKLIGTGYVPSSTGLVQQGVSVAYDAEGKTLIVGGNQDGGFIGAAWIFS